MLRYVKIILAIRVMPDGLFLYRSLCSCFCKYFVMIAVLYTGNACYACIVVRFLFSDIPSDIWSDKSLDSP